MPGRCFCEFSCQLAVVCLARRRGFDGGKVHGECVDCRCRQHIPGHLKEDVVLLGDVVAQEGGVTGTRTGGGGCVSGGDGITHATHVRAPRHVLVQHTRNGTTLGGHSLCCQGRKQAVLFLCVMMFVGKMCDEVDRPLVECQRLRRACLLKSGEDLLDDPMVLHEFVDRVWQRGFSSGCQSLVSGLVRVRRPGLSIGIRRRVRPGQRCHRQRRIYATRPPPGAGPQRPDRVR